MLDLVISGGTVVTAEATYAADVGVKDGRVVIIGRPEIMPGAAESLDATGKYVLPGLLDTHCHFAFDFGGTCTRDDFYTGSIAAACGGVTCVIDFAMQMGDQTLSDAIAKRRAEADGRVVFDYALHGVVTNPTDAIVAGMKDAVAGGVPSFKSFMIYRKEGVYVEDGAVLAMMRQAAELGALFGAHPESALLAEWNFARLVAKKQFEPQSHALAKPNLVEAECYHRALFLADAAGAGFYGFHISARESVALVRAARRAGRPIYADTQTHYLILTDEVLKRPDGANFICSPPFRSRADQDELWRGLADGTVSCVSSDHVAYDLKHKKAGNGRFHETINGGAGVEFRLPALYSEGVGRGRITPNRLVAVTSTNAARIFGLYPRKGTIAVGSDADMVVLDPRRQVKLTASMSHMPVDWTAFDGLSVTGFPVATVAGGKVIVKDGKFVGKAGAGRFIPRKLPAETLAGPVA